MEIKDSTITIMVKDMEKSLTFYQSIGLTIKNRWGNHYAEVAAPGLVIGLHPDDGTNPASGSGNVSIGFTADNFEETKSSLQKLPVEIMERHEEGGEFIHFNDPDGTALYFIKPKW